MSNTTLAAAEAVGMRVPSSMYTTNRFYQFGVFGTILVASGLTSNCLTVVLLSRRRLNSRINPFLKNLAFWDCFLLSVAWVMCCMVPLIHGGRVPVDGPWVLLYPFGYYLNNAAHVGCVWSIVITNTDRFMAVCQPFFHQRMRNWYVTRCAIVGVAVFAFCYEIPKYFEVQIDYNCSWGLDRICLFSSSLMSHPVYIYFYRVACSILFTSLIPILLLAALNVAILFELHKSQKLRRLHAVNYSSLIAIRLGRPSRSVSYMLLAIFCKFIFCYTLPCALDLADFLIHLDFPGYGRIIDASDFLVMLHSATNFYVYLLFSHRFRDEFLLLFRPGVRSKCSRTSATVVPKDKLGLGPAPGSTNC